MRDQALRMLNGLGLGACLVASLVVSLVTQRSDARTEPAQAAPVAAEPLVDASGKRFEQRNYQRIASGSIVSDRLLLALCEPERIVAFSPQASSVRDRQRFTGKPTITSLDRTEALLELHADLVFVSGLGDPGKLRTLREAGVPVFDLGPLVGTESVLRAADSVGALLGRSEQARELSDRFLRDLRTLAQDVPPASRKSALYVAVYGTQIFGGTRGSSFGEVLTYAGLRDAAPPELRGWPRYTSEELLRINPEIVVTQHGMGDALCRLPGAVDLRVCADRKLLIELDTALLDDPGLGILDAAEALFAVVYAR